MGAIRPAVIKRVARELVEKYPDKFTADFNVNKELVAKYTNVQTKKVRNLLAGYVTRYYRNIHTNKPRREPEEQEEELNL
ncbi:MAG: 30S ribosomal protein S17e [Thermoplasmata archaeon]|jgi:small subunit ribosomal protein S17e|nr:30S ribosomal protein S17e [Thermoplasmatales archaeon]PMP74370.1 MAG: 30S ribosomal protein S17e [Aciduliprofundum sp.]